MSACNMETHSGTLGKKRKYFCDDGITLTDYAQRKYRKISRSRYTDVSVVNSKKKKEPEMIIQSPENEISNYWDLEDDAFINQYFHEYESPMPMLEARIEPELFQLEQENDSSGDEEFLNILSGNNSTETDFLNDDKFFEQILVNIHQSPAELLLISMKYSIKNRLSRTALLDLLKFVNVICGKKILPETNHKLDKFCPSENDITFHAVCPTCDLYLGKFVDLNESGKVKCKNCNAEVNTKNRSNSCYFVTIDPSSDLRKLLEDNENYYDDIMFKRNHEKNHLKDIYDGEKYREFVEHLSINEKHAYATLSLNTDGAPKFKNSGHSIWPIYVTPNEIPISERLKSTVVCGLWFGKGKPNMLAFLDSFVEMMNNLSRNGIQCTIKNEDRRIKIFSLLACVDSIARNKMNGTCQFNGKYGCDWCLHEGIHFAGSRRYPFTVPPHEMRSKKGWIEHAKKAAQDKKRVFGVDYVSPLLYLNHFDIVHGFLPDYMHCILEGVVEQLTEKLLDQMSAGDRDYLDNLMFKIKAPHILGKLSRFLSKRKDWKALEWENWLLFYSLPLLDEVIDDKDFVKHWALLVDSLHILLSMDVTYDDLNVANRKLHKFVQEVEDHYSMTDLTYNVHQLLHICDSVRNWGPLWAHSAFSFESANYRLLTAIHCSNGVILQIIHFLNMQNTIDKLECKIYSGSPTTSIKFYENLSSKYAKKTLKLTNTTYFGKGEQVQESIRNHFNLPLNTRKFFKIVTRGFLLTSSFKINDRSCNYFAQLNNGRFIKILYFFVIPCQNKEYTICRILETENYNYTSYIKKISNMSTEILINTQKILRPCVVIETTKGSFISPVPNTLHY